MANFLKNIIFCSFALFIASCGGAGGSSSGGGDADELNVILDLPILIGGKEISFTVTSASGASVPVGLTIIYDFERTNGRVSGLNPVSNQTYNPNSYSFTATDRSVTVLLDYGSGNAEEYVLMPSASCGNNGTYRSRSFIGGTEVASARGNYSIVGGVCFDFDEQAPPVQQVTEVEGTIQNLKLNEFLSGTIDYSTLSGSGSDQRDQYSYTVPSSFGIQLVQVILSWQGDADDIDLVISSQHDYAFSTGHIGYRSPLTASDGRVVKYFYLNELGSTTTQFTVEGRETGGIKDYNLVITREGLTHPSLNPENYYKNKFVGGQWNVTDTITSNSCGFANGAQPVYQMDIRQTGSVLAVTSNVFSTLVGKVYPIGSNTYAGWSGSYPFMGGTLTLTDVQLFPQSNGLDRTVAYERLIMQGGSSWTWTDGSTNCGGEMSIAATPASLVSESLSAVEITSDLNAPTTICCTISGPRSPNIIEATFPGTQVAEWHIDDMEIAGGDVEWEVTVEGGTAHTLTDRGAINILKMFTQSADWKLTVTNPSTLAQTIVTGRIEATTPPGGSGPFADAEPACLENFPLGICDAIGDPESIGLPAKGYAASSFSGTSLTCAGLGYSSQQTAIMPALSPGADPTSTCTYRE